MNTNEPTRTGTLEGHAFAYRPGVGETGLLLLHGTGGNEHDLIPIGRQLAPGAPLLSPRGRVLERGMPRFFRRLAEGVFDIPDLLVRTKQLVGFLRAVPDQLQGSPRHWVALGYSNGANMASGLAFSEPGLLAGAILLRPMVPYNPDPSLVLPGFSVLLQFGSMDPIVTRDEADRLTQLYYQTGADVEVRTLEAGHGLTPADLEISSAWLSKHSFSFKDTHKKIE